MTSRLGGRKNRQLFYSEALSLRGPSLRYSAPGFLHKLDLYGKVTKELGQKIQQWDGLCLKIANLYFLAL